MLFGKTKQQKTVEVIEAIHNEFNTAGDQMLAEAKRILSSISISNEDKAKMLSHYGFSNTAESREYEQVAKKKQMAENTARAIEHFYITLPKYKFITQEEARAICKKYNLVIGDVTLYRGFVPDKNLKQIDEFFREKNEVTYWHARRHYWSSGSTMEEITEEKYNQYLQGGLRHNVEHSRRRLFIAAPVKDMDTKGMKVVDGFLKSLKPEIPDPVVLCPIEKNGVSLYCIVTAWGDEASDPLVVNEKKN